MLKITFLFMNILFISSCAEEIIWSYFSDFRQEKPQRILPPSFVECSDAFFWSTGKFIPRTSFSTDIEVSSDPDAMPNRSGSRSSLLSSSDAATQRICNDIQHKITGSGPYVEHRLSQSFSYSQVISSINSSNEFEEIDAGNGYIFNASYSLDPSLSIRTYIENIGFPITVKCDNKWQVKKDLSQLNAAFFIQPLGKCHFSLEDYNLELLSGKKVNIAFQGYYEIEQEFPNKIMLIHIERFGFRELH